MDLAAGTAGRDPGKEGHGVTRVLEQVHAWEAATLARTGSRGDGEGLAKQECAKTRQKGTTGKRSWRGRRRSRTGRGACSHPDPAGTEAGLEATTAVYSSFLQLPWSSPARTERAGGTRVRKRRGTKGGRGQEEKGSEAGLGVEVAGGLGHRSDAGSRGRGRGLGQRSRCS